MSLERRERKRRRGWKLVSEGVKKRALKKIKKGPCPSGRVVAE